MHKLKSLGITGQLGIWVNNFLRNRTQYVQIPGGVSEIGAVTSGVPQGTVLGPVLFLLLMLDIDSDLKFSKASSFADDTRLYSAIKENNQCAELQKDLLTIYEWANSNNMKFNSHKFQYVSFQSKSSATTNNTYLSPSNDILQPTNNVKDLGILMSSDCTFEEHINNVVKSCSRLVGWVLRTFSTRVMYTMITLFKSIILPRLEYGSQLWSPHLQHMINNIERVQRTFTKYITGMYDLSYEERLKALSLYSLQRRRDRYMIIYIWKIIESLVPNLQPKITLTSSTRRGRLCCKENVPRGRQGTLMFNSFRWQAIRLFNSLPSSIRNISRVNVKVFKAKLDSFLSKLRDAPSIPYEKNNIDKRIEEIPLLWRASTADLAV